MNDIRKITVNTEAASHNLTLLATVKRALNVTGTDDDTFLTESIARASAAIATYCKRVFGQETVTERIWLSSCRDVLNLKRYPNITVASVTIDAVAIDEEDDVLVSDDSGQLIRLENGNPSQWPACQWIEIEYEAGYELLGALPYEIEEACILLVKSAYSAKGRDPMVKSEEVMGVQRIDYWVGSTSGADLPDEVRVKIDPFRNLAV